MKWQLIIYYVSLLANPLMVILCQNWCGLESHGSVILECACVELITLWRHDELIYRAMGHTNVICNDHITFLVNRSWWWWWHLTLASPFCVWACFHNMPVLHLIYWLLFTSITPTYISIVCNLLEFGLILSYWSILRSLGWTYIPWVVLIYYIVMLLFFVWSWYLLDYVNKDNLRCLWIRYCK